MTDDQTEDLTALDDMALDRLKNAVNQFELDKACAIAQHVQWRINLLIASRLKTID